MTLDSLVELAERKLGKGATVQLTREGWIAKVDTAKGTLRATAKTKDTLIWFLERMPDVK